MKDVLSDFSSAGTKSPRFRLSIAGLVWELLLVTLVFGVPAAQSYYADYGLSLSYFTIQVIRISRAVIAFAPKLLVLVCAVWLVQHAIHATTVVRISRAMSVFVIACPVILLALNLIALGLPLLNLMGKLRG